MIRLDEAFMQAANRLPTLYELSADYLELAAFIEQADEDEDFAALAMKLDALEGSIKQKADNIIGFVRWLEALAAARRGEAKRMAEGARHYEERAEWLRAYVLSHMQALAIPRIDTARFSVSVHANPPRVDVLEEALIPDEFKHRREVVDVDKRAILAYTKASGEVVPGTEIVRGQRLDIR